VTKSTVDLAPAVILTVDGYKWNLEKTDPRDLIYHMMLLVFDQRSSLKALKDNGQKMIDLLEEIKVEVQTLTVKSRRLWRSYCTRVSAKLSWIIETDDWGKMLTMLYDCLLSLDGLGTLGGFSTKGSIDKGLMNYNPERKSIMARY